MQDHSVMTPIFTHWSAKLHNHACNFIHHQGLMHSYIWCAPDPQSKAQIVKTSYHSTRTPKPTDFCYADTGKAWLTKKKITSHSDLLSSHSPTPRPQSNQTRHDMKICALESGTEINNIIIISLVLLLLWLSWRLLAVLRSNQFTLFLITWLCNLSFDPPPPYNTGLWLSA